MNKEHIEKALKKKLRKERAKRKELEKKLLQSRRGLVAHIMTRM